MFINYKRPKIMSVANIPTKPRIIMEDTDCQKDQKITKYQVIRCDSQNADYYRKDDQKPTNELNCEILGTFCDRKQAIEFMVDLINEQHDQKDGWVAINQDSNKTFSIYHRAILSGKYLISKYHLLEYTDCNNCSCICCYNKL